MNEIGLQRLLDKRWQLCFLNAGYFLDRAAVAPGPAFLRMQ